MLGENDRLGMTHSKHGGSSADPTAPPSTWSGRAFQAQERHPKPGSFPQDGAGIVRPQAREGRDAGGCRPPPNRSEEHTSELQSLMRISYAVFCLKKKNTNNHKL